MSTFSSFEEKGWFLVCAIHCIITTFLHPKSLTSKFHWITLLLVKFHWLYYCKKETKKIFPLSTLSKVKHHFALLSLTNAFFDPHTCWKRNDSDRLFWLSCHSLKHRTASSTVSTPIFTCSCKVISCLWPGVFIPANGSYILPSDRAFSAVTAGSGKEKKYKKFMLDISYISIVLDIPCSLIIWFHQSQRSCLIMTRTVQRMSWKPLIKI